jgi:hypothetical protein
MKSVMTKYRPLLSKGPCTSCTPCIPAIPTRSVPVKCAATRCTALYPDDETGKKNHARTHAHIANVCSQQFVFNVDPTFQRMEKKERRNFAHTISCTASFLDGERVARVLSRTRTDDDSLVYELAPFRWPPLVPLSALSGISCRQNLSTIGCFRDLKRRPHSKM